MIYLKVIGILLVLALISVGAFKFLICFFGCSKYSYLRKASHIIRKYYWSFVLLVFIGGGLYILGEINDINEANKSVSYGEYVGKLVVEPLDDGREMRLSNDFAYNDNENGYWLAPKGVVVNGASIPQVFWTIIGSPWVGKYRNSSVIHDVACANKAKEDDIVHLVFYRGMRTSGVEEAEAALLYMVVRDFGPTWQLLSEVETQVLDFNTSFASLGLSDTEVLFENQQGIIYRHNGIDLYVSKEIEPTEKEIERIKSMYQSVSKGESDLTFEKAQNIVLRERKITSKEIEAMYYNRLNDTGLDR